MKKAIEFTERGILLPPEIDDVTRREFLIGSAGLLLLPTACGGNGEGEEPGSGETRTVEHFAGTTEVPAEPSRVVALDTTVAVGLIRLGLIPTGAADNLDEWMEQYTEVLPDDLDVDEIEQFGAEGEANLEAIAAIGPDLILGTSFDEEIYEQLSEIAPTVLVERESNGGWRERFRAAAEAVGRTQRAEEVEADYEQVISDIPEDVKESTVAFIRPSNGQFRIDGIETAFAGSVAEDAGIPSLAPEDVGEVEEESGFISVSGELLSAVEEADLIVVPDYRSIGEESDSISQFENNPLWETLPAVQAGQVVQVPGLVYNGGNHFAAELLLREIEEALA